MKLKTKIAGSLALPLALAVAANSAQAFTVVDDADKKVTIGGYLSAITYWDKVNSDDKFNNAFSAGTSRLNIGYTDKETGTRFFYEQQFVGGLGAPDTQTSNGLRHAYFATEDGLIGGYTWSFGTNLVALADTIDTQGNSLVSYQVGGPRNLLLGQKFKLDDGLSVGLSLENQNNTVGGDDNAAKKSVVPAVTANFEGEFADTKVFAAWTNYAVNNDDGAGHGKDKRANRLTLGTNVGLGDANVKLGVTQNFGVKDNGEQLLESASAAKGTHVSAALGFKVNEKVRTNLATEYSKWDKKVISKAGDGAKAGTAYRVWLNAFYLADNGIEWGAEYSQANVKAAVNDVPADVVLLKPYGGSEGALQHKGKAIRLQAKYAF